MKVRPLQDWVILRLFDEEKLSTVIHVLSENRTRKGEVLAVGPGRRRGKRFIPTQVQPGDIAAFFIGNLRTKQGKQLTSVVSELVDGTGMIREEDILFVCPPERKVQ